MSTKIDWVKNTDGTSGRTWDLTGGCTRCSPGCDNCFALRECWRLAHNPTGGLMERYDGLVEYGERDGELKLDWTGRVKLFEDRLDVPLRTRKPTTFFVCSKSDLFHEDVPEEVIDRVLAVAALCPRHTFLILTKRAARMGQYFDLLAERVREWDSGEGETEEFLITSALNSCECSVLVENACFGWLNMFNARHLGWPLPNVWLGVTVCNQAEADEKIPQLLQIPAAVRFVSVEPMLGPIDLNEWLGKWVCENASGSCGHFIYPSHKDCNSDCEEDCDGHCPHCGCDIAYDAPWQHETTLDWIICGGESGPGARPMHPDWPRKLRDDCVAAGVPYFFKQWGEWIHTPIWSSTKYLEARKVGKKAAGHLLDGQEWRQMPEVTR